MAGVARLAGQKKILLAGETIDPDHFTQLYAKLSDPKLREGRFFESPQIRGALEKHSQRPGLNVSFERNLPVAGWTMENPDEILRQKFIQPQGEIDRFGQVKFPSRVEVTPQVIEQIRQAPSANNDLRQFVKHFNQLVDTPEGQGVYTNVPEGGLDGRRSQFYQSQFGFSNVPDTPYQILDSRPVKSRLDQQILALGDLVFLSPEENVGIAKSRQQRNRLPIQLENDVYVAGVPGQEIANGNASFWKLTR